MNSFYHKSMRFLFFMLCVGSTSVLATEIVHYKNLPVTIELQNGRERSIQFGDHVQVGITKGQQMMKLFRVQSAQGFVHFLPYKEFDKQRVQIKRLSDGQVILLDLVSTEAAPEAGALEDIKILLETDNTIPDLAEESDEAEFKTPVVTPVDLTRHAAQRLYGPTRLHRDIPGINETILGVKGPIKVFKGEAKYKTYSKAVLAYQGGGYYLAAIHITNISERDLNLDYLDLNLPFSHATFQHHTLRPSGIPGDSTVLYLISERPLKETLYPWTYYQDLAAEAEALQREQSSSGAFSSHSRRQSD